MDLVAEQPSDGAKKRFAATDAGRALLAEQAETVAALMARLASIGAHRNRHDGAPIRRAMGNLRQAVQDRLSHGEVSPDTLHDIAALIDEVAQKVERLR
jgi:DNA-binding PadR family transcriptional regulator